MYRNRSYSENNDWENLNQSQRGNSNFQHYEPSGNNQRRNQPQSYEDRRGLNPQLGHNQNREDAFGPGYGLRRENRRNQDYNMDYDHPQQSRNQYNDFRGSYRLDNESNDSGYRRLHERNFGPDYGYGHAGSSRTGGDYGRSQSDYGSGSTYGASRNAGSMGSYGGAQGYGSSTNGYNSSKWGSGHKGVQHQPYHTVYGAYRDKNSFAPGERESYDGSQRSGSQGADNTRGWVTPGRSGRSGSYQHRTAEEDSPYEIYDSALSQYNRGDYNNSAEASISSDLHLNSHQEFSPNKIYGSRERSRYRQGTGSDQDRYLGSDLDYQNTGGSPDSNYDQDRSFSGRRNRYYDSQTGDAWNPGSERS